MKGDEIKFGDIVVNKGDGKVRINGMVDGSMEI